MEERAEAMECGSPLPLFSTGEMVVRRWGSGRTVWSLRSVRKRQRAAALHMDALHTDAFDDQGLTYHE